MNRLDHLPVSFQFYVGFNWVSLVVSRELCTATVGFLTQAKTRVPQLQITQFDTAFLFVLSPVSNLSIIVMVADACFQIRVGYPLRIGFLEDLSRCVKWLAGFKVASQLSWFTSQVLII